MTTKRPFKNKPRRRYVPNVRQSQLPIPPKDSYTGGDPAIMLDNAIGKMEYCFRLIHGLAREGEIGGTATLQPMHEALKWVRGARDGLKAAPPQVPDPSEYGRLD